MFGIQTLTAFVFALVVFSVTAAVPASIGIKLVRTVSAQDWRTAGAFGAIGAGLLTGLLFHWPAVTAGFDSILRGAIRAGNAVGAYEAFYLPISLVLIGVGILVFQSEDDTFTLGEEA